MSKRIIALTLVTLSLFAGSFLLLGTTARSNQPTLVAEGGGPPPPIPGLS